MNVNFAERAHNHNWKLDPIVRSLLDTDFYKLLMLQFIWKNFADVHVTSEVVNRTVKVRLAERVGRETTDPLQQIDRAYRIALARPAAKAEIAIATDLIRHQSLAAFTHVLLNLDEFIYIR